MENKIIMGSMLIMYKQELSFIFLEKNENSVQKAADEILLALTVASWLGREAPGPNCLLSAVRPLCLPGNH